MGSLGVKHLKRFWAKAMAQRRGESLPNNFIEEEYADRVLLDLLSLGLEPTIRYLFSEAPEFDEFEEWIKSQNPEGPDPSNLKAFNEAISEEDSNAPQIDPKYLLSKEQWDFWNENGYLVLPQVISEEDCEKTLEMIAEFISIDLNDPSSWYENHPARQGIMVQLFNHPLLDQNRRSEAIRSAYEQLWDNHKIWVSADRVSFNPPENDNWKFPGPLLHWDLRLDPPIPFGLQGLLYLSDTKEDQGAFTLVPGFHKKIDNWLNELGEGESPGQQDLYSLGPKPISARAGDFIIWHHALPHGSAPNRSDKPRIVQYINYHPIKKKRERP